MWVLRYGCQMTVWRPAARGVAIGTTSCFWSLGSTIAAAAAIGFPLSSLRSTPENFAITPSVKFSLISVGEPAAETFAPGLAEVNVGCAPAEAPSRLAADNGEHGHSDFFCTTRNPFCLSWVALDPWSH